MQCRCTWHALGFMNHNPGHVWPHLLGGSASPWEVSGLILSNPCLTYLCWMWTGLNLVVHPSQYVPHYNRQFFIELLIGRLKRLLRVVSWFVFLWLATLIDKNIFLRSMLMPWSLMPLGRSNAEGNLSQWLFLDKRRRRTMFLRTVRSDVTTYATIMAGGDKPVSG
jgi:hypothetical protein